MTDPKRWRGVLSGAGSPNPVDAMPAPPAPPTLPAEPKADWYQVWVEWFEPMPPQLKVLIAYEAEPRYDIAWAGGSVIATFDNLTEAECFLEEDEHTRLTWRIDAHEHLERPLPAAEAHGDD